MQRVHDEARPARSARGAATSATPSATEPLSSNSATAPVERVRYQSSFSARCRDRRARSRARLPAGRLTSVIAAVTRRRRPLADPQHRAAPVDQPRRHAECSSHRRSAAFHATAPQCSRCSRPTQSAAATLTVRQMPRAGHPLRVDDVVHRVRRRAPAARDVLEVARPPSRNRDRADPGAAGPARWSSVTWIPAARRGATRSRDIAPERDQHAASTPVRRRRSDRRRALWRSPRGPARCRGECGRSSSLHPGRRSPSHRAAVRAPPRTRGLGGTCRGSRARGSAAASRGHSRRAPVRLRPSDRRRRRSARPRAARPRVPRSAVARPAPRARPRGRLLRESSESSRNRLQLRSIASSSAGHHRPRAREARGIADAEHHIRAKRLPVSRRADRRAVCGAAAGARPRMYGEYGARHARDTHDPPELTGADCWVGATEVSWAAGDSSAGANP